MICCTSCSYPVEQDTLIKPTSLRSSLVCYPEISLTDAARKRPRRVIIVGDKDRTRVASAWPTIQDLVAPLLDSQMEISVYT